MAFEMPITYAEFGTKIKEVAVSLLHYGVKRGDRIAILSENSPIWGVIYLAIVRLGAIAVPILPDFLESDVRHIITDSEVKILFASGRQLEKLYEMSSKKLEMVVVMDDSPVEHRPISIVKYSEFLSSGQKDFREDKRKRYANWTGR